MSAGAPHQRRKRRGLHGRIRRFARLPRPRKVLLAEAAVHLLRARLLVWRRGQHQAIAAATQVAPASHAEPEIPGGGDIARDVEWAIARLSPWMQPHTNRCLVQAIAASRMLSRRGVPWTLKVGVGRDADALTAHAWLLYGNRVVTGGAGVRTVTPIATYARPEAVTRAAG